MRRAHVWLQQVSLELLSWVGMEGRLESDQDVLDVVMLHAGGQPNAS